MIPCSFVLLTLYMVGLISLTLLIGHSRLLLDRLTRIMNVGGSLESSRCFHSLRYYRNLYKVKHGFTIN